jgi:hypothetical protein
LGKSGWAVKDLCWEILVFAVGISTVNIDPVSIQRIGPAFVLALLVLQSGYECSKSQSLL